MKNQQPTLDEIVSLCKRRGFVYQTSSIYGGLANSYDYGPLGAQLLKNIKDAWWKEFIATRTDMVGLDTQIMLHPETWVASGHVGSFSDPLVEDKVTHKRYRADHLIKKWAVNSGQWTVNGEQLSIEEIKIRIDEMSLEQMGEFIKENKIKSPDGNEVTEPKSFNLLFETSIGSVAGDKAKVYLRGETAQGIFTNFKQVLDTTRVQLPFGIGNIGKSFRNEITTGQFVFRTLEFEQAEIEYFFDPDKSDWTKLFEDWKNDMWQFVTERLGINSENLRWRRHTDNERSHYSKDTYDLDYKFPFGWDELWGVAYRTDYDLTAQQKHSGKSLEYTDPNDGKKFIPHVIEPALGIGRAFLMVMTDAYFIDQEKNRTVLKLKPSLAPYKLAVFPLVKNKEEIVAKAKEVFDILSPQFASIWDERGNIGKRYLYQDEIGTPYCVTVDYQTLEDETVTVRDRDSAEQVRVKIDQLEEWLGEKICI